MKYQSRFFSIAALALYVIQVVGGQAAHQLQHLASDALCCEERVTTTCSAGSGNHNHGSHHGTKAIEPGFAANSYSFLRTPLPSGDGQENATSECWTCHVLSQAAKVSLKVELVVTEAATFPVAMATPGLFLSPILGPVKSRGPPAFLV